MRPRAAHHDAVVLDLATPGLAPVLAELRGGGRTRLVGIAAAPRDRLAGIDEILVKPVQAAPVLAAVARRSAGSRVRVDPPRRERDAPHTGIADGSVA